MDDEAKNPSEPVAIASNTSEPTENPSPNGALQKKSVSFHKQTKPAKVMPPPQSKPLPPTKFGKANPVRDICLVTVIFSAMLYLTYDSGPSADKPKGPTGYEKVLQEFAEGVNRAFTGASDTLEKALNERMFSNRRSDSCDLFTTESSIPDSGLGLFAGKSYNPGDIVVNHTSVLYPLSIEGLNHFFVPLHGFLIKHHPLLANVQGKLISDDFSSPSTFELRATKSIAPGEELFVSFNEHPHGILTERAGGDFNDRYQFRKIPAKPDYELADEIYEGLPTVEDSKTFQMNRAPETRYRVQAQMSRSNQVYAAVQKSMMKVNPMIAKLLPANPSQARAFKEHRTSALGALKTKSLIVLQAVGTCLTDLVLLRESGATISTRDAKAEQKIAEIPMLAIKNPVSCANDEQGECRSMQYASIQKTCVGQSFSKVILCPLVPTTLFTNAKASEDGGNIKVRWKDLPILLKAVEELFNDPTRDASFIFVEVIAQSAVMAGQELNFVEALDDLIPPAWRLA